MVRSARVATKAGCPAPGCLEDAHGPLRADSRLNLVSGRCRGIEQDYLQACGRSQEIVEDEFGSTLYSRYCW
jgi:hypothetical protein